MISEFEKELNEKREIDEICRNVIEQSQFLFAQFDIRASSIYLGEKLLLLIRHTANRYPGRLILGKDGEYFMSLKIYVVIGDRNHLRVV